MALKALMLRKKIDSKKKELENLRAKDTEFQTREAELETSIAEAATEEEHAVVDEEVEKFESDKKQHEDAKTDLEKEISDLEAELQEEERSQKPPVNNREERNEPAMNTARTKFFGMTIQERDAFIAREDVKTFLGKVRTCMKEKRALNNVGLTIPEVMLPMLREVVEATSKLYRKVNVVQVTGTARQTIMGTIPEAIWTEMCGILNELDLGFNDVEVDGYKVGGYFQICNATLEDSDLNLTSELITALGKAIGKALDKAILYGKGVKMPLGVVTRLVQTVKPDAYPETARPWEDLSTKHILTGTGATGMNLFKEIAKAAGVAVDDYSTDGLTWCMNKKTHMEIVVNSMDKNANAAIVAGMNKTMPVVGGEIVELSFIPEGTVVFGYFDMYLLAERAGTQIKASEHAKFIEDRTIVKGTARYDGQPVIAEAFGTLSITTTAPTTSVDFPGDKANTNA